MAIYKCVVCGKDGAIVGVEEKGMMHEKCSIEYLGGINRPATGMLLNGPALGERDHEHEEKVAFSSGATMSRLDERYDLICPVGLRRLAARYGLGVPKHGEFNWCSAGNDKAFQRARLNHMIRHMVAYLQEGNAKDDNLAAIAWGAFALMHYEESCSHHEQKLP
jgi:hypothetical protein